MHFDDWWALNEEYCDTLTPRQIALRAWAAIKAYHRIPESDGCNVRSAALDDAIEFELETQYP